MYILYIDEAGRPEKQSSTPIFVLSGIAIKDTSWRQLTTDIYNAMKKYYPAWFSNHRINNIGDLKKRERSLKRLTQPSHLRISNNKKQRSRNRKNLFFVKDVLQICKKHNAKVFVAGIIKREIKKDPNIRWIYPNLLQKITLIYNKFLINAEENGLIVLDSNTPDFQDMLTFQHIGFLFGNKLGKRCTRIISTPLFIKSHFSIMIQCISYITSLVYAIHANKVQNQSNPVYKIDYSYTSKLLPYLNSLFVGNESSKNGFIVYK